MTTNNFEKFWEGSNAQMNKDMDQLTKQRNNFMQRHNERMAEVFSHTLDVAKEPDTETTRKEDPVETIDKLFADLATL